MTQRSESVASSAFSAESAGSTVKGAGVVAEMNMLGTLSQLLPDWQSKLGVLSTVVQFIQLLGMIINTSTDWGPAMTLISKGTSFFVIPIWEPTFVASHRKEISMVFFWLYVAILAVAVVTIFLLLTDEGRNRASQRLVTYTKRAVHAASSIGFLPISNTFMSFLICKNNTNPRSFPSEKCWSAWHTIHFTAASASLATLCLITYISNGILFNISPKNTFMTTNRANSHFDQLLIVTKLTLVTVYHITLGDDDSVVFPVTVMVSMALLSVWLAVVLPYYSLRMTQLSSACYATVFWAGATSFIKQLSSRDFTDNNLPLVLLAGGGVVAFCVGFALPSIRPSSHCRAALCKVSMGEVTAGNAAFPENLPEFELPLCRCAGLCEQVDPQNQNLQDESILSGERSVPLEVMDSYLTAIYTPSDIEVAARFTQEYIASTGQMCTPKMLRFGMRHFTKGIVKYPENAHVILHLVNYLVYCAGGVGIVGITPVVICITSALTETEHINGMDAGRLTHFQNHLMQTMIKPLIGMTNDSHKKVVASALRIYKDILGQMLMFWNKLLVSENVDTIQLAVIARNVTSRRGEGLEAFRKALLHPTYNLVRKYAQFLRYVMIDEDSAHTLESKLSYMQREKNLKQSGGAQDLGEVTSEMNSRKVRVDQETDNSRMSSTIKKFSITINIIFVTLVVIILMFITVEAVLSAERDHLVDQVETAGTMRAVGAQSAVVVKRIHSISSDGTLASEQLDNIVVLKGSLHGIALQYQHAHYALFHGSLTSSYAPLNDFLNGYCGHIELQRDGTTNRVTTRLRSMSLRYLNTLFSIANSTTALTGDLVRANDIAYIEANAIPSLGAVLNRSMEFYSDAHDAAEETFQWVVTCIFGCSILLVFFVYFTMASNFQKVGSSKFATLNLFKYIPHVHLEKLSEEASNRVAQCDMDDAGQEGLDTLIELNDVENEKEMVSSDSQMKVKPVVETKVLATSLNNNDNTSNSDRSEEIDIDGQEPLTVTRTASNNASYKAIIPALLVISLVVLYIMCICNTAVLLVAIHDVSEVSENYHSDKETRSWEDSYYTAIEKLTLEARSYTQEGSRKHIENYFNLINTGVFSRMYENLMLRAGTESDVTRYIRTASSLDAMITLQLISFTLVQSVVDDGNLYQWLPSPMLGHQWDYNGTELYYVLNFHDGKPIAPPMPHPTSADNDLSLSASHKMDLARALLFCERHQLDVEAALGSLRVVRGLDGEYESLRGVAGVSITFGTLQIISIGVIFAVARMQTGFEKIYSFRAVLCFCTALSISSIALGSAFIHESKSASSATTVELSLLTMRNATHHAYASAAANVLGYIQFGDSKFKTAYESGLESSIFDQVMESGVEYTGTPKEYVELINAYERLHLVRSLEKVAISRSLAVHHKNTSTPMEYQYVINEKQKLHLMMYDVGGGAGFTDSKNDSELGDDVQLGIARRVMSSPIHGTAVVESKTPFLNTIEKAVDEQHEAVEEKHESLEALLKIALVAEVAILVILVVYAAVATSVFLNIIGGFDYNTDFFPVLMRNCRVSLTVLTVLITVAYSISFANQASTVDTVKAYHYASTREWLMSQSMVTAMTLFETDLTVHEKHLALSTIQREASNMFKNRMQITKLPRTTSFDSSSYGAIPDNPLRTCSSVSSSTSLTRLTQLSKGVEVAMYSWGALLEKLAAQNPEQDFQNPVGKLLNIKEKLYNLQENLYEESRKGAKLQAAHSRDLISAASLLLYLFLCGVMLVVFLGFVFVFRPMVRYLRVEEEGTTLMLTMIPQDVRENVPAIAEYLSTGVITIDEKIQESNEWIVEFSAVSTIVIDHLGTISRFSRAARDMFGYELDEVIGKNLKMLMIDEQAAAHDGYLANYRKTGVKKIIGTARRVVALRKNGALIDISIMVRELRRAGRDPVFIGNLLNLKEEIQMEKETMIGNSMIKASILPIIIADTKGIVTSLSETARLLFGIKKRANIKSIMPEEVAAKHDTYLQNYVTTRKKNIIGKVLNITAVTPHGDISMELMIMDFYDSEGNLDGFVGYLRDLTSTNDIKFASRMCETSLNLTPDPMIKINRQGTILTFNTRAVEKFGYEVDDVIGKNINILMHPDIAKEHHEYLARYLRTGEKKVINSITKVQVRTKEGAYIEGDLGVREVEEFYIAYFRDTKLERELQKQLNVQKKVLLNSSEAIVIISDKGIIENVGEVCCDLFGYEEDELVGQNVRMLMPEATGRAHDGYLLAYSQTKVKKVINNSQEVKGRAKSGILLPIELFVIEVTHGETTLFVGTLTDTTQRTEVQKVMALNKQIIARSGGPVIVSDHIGTITDFNAASESVFGWKASEIIGKNVSLLQSDAVAARHDRYLMDYLKTGKKKILDNPRILAIKKRDGEQTAVELTVKEFRVEGLNPIFMASVREITLDMQESDLSNRIKFLIDNPQYLYISITRSGIVTAFNEAAEVTTQYKKEEILGKNIKMILPDGVAKNHDEFLRTYLRTGKKRVIDQVTDTTCKRKDGILVPVELHVKELRLSANHVVFIAYIKDMMSLQIAVRNNYVKDSLIQACPSPLISTDLYGTILTWNPASELETGWTQEHTIGKNIKIIQPREVAKAHDGYLKAYRKTGIKHVLDSSRAVSVKRKDATQYKAVLWVTEVTINKKKSFLGCMNNIEGLEKIKHEEQQGELLLNISLAAYISIDVVGKIIMFNKRACDMFGYSPEEVLGENIKMLMLEPHRSRHDEYLSNYLVTRKKVMLGATQLFEVLKKNGKTTHAEVNVKEMKVRDTVQYIGHLTEATSKYEFQRDGEICKEIMAMAPTPLIVINGTGVIQMVNKTISDLFGYSFKEMVGANVSMLMPQEIAIFHDEYLERYHVTGIRRVVGTVRLVTGKKRDGATFPVRISVVEIIVDESKFFVSAVEDVEEEEMLEKTVQKTKQLLDLSPVAVIVMGIDGIIKIANRAIFKTFGHDPADLIGKKVDILMPEHIANNHDTFLANYKKTGVKRIIGSKRVVVGKRVDSSEFMAEVSVSEVVGSERTPNTYIGYIRDMTVEEQANEACIISNTISTLSIIPIVSIDVEGHILKFTPSAEMVFGWEASEVLSQNVSMLMPKTVGDKHDGYLKAYTDTGKRTMIDKRTKVTAAKRDGKLFPASVSIKEVVGNKYFASTFIGFVEDESAQYEMELAMRMNTILLDVSIVPIIKIDLKGTILYANPASQAMFGYEARELTGTNIKRIVGVEHRDKHDGYLAKYLKTGEKHVLDTTRTVLAAHKTEPEFSVVIKVREVNSETGRVYIGFVEKLGKLAKIGNTKLINTVLTDLIQLPLIVINQAGIIVKFSSSATHVLGYSELDAVGRPVTIIIPPDIAATHQERVDTYIRTKVRVMIGASTDVNAYSKLGGLIPATISVHQITTSKGLFFVGLIDPHL